MAQDFARILELAGQERPDHGPQGEIEDLVQPDAVLQGALR